MARIHKRNYEFSEYFLKSLLETCYKDPIPKIKKNHNLHMNQILRKSMNKI